MELNAVRRGVGPPLLLVPGLGSTWQTFEPVLPGLSESRRVIAVDLPGFGQSPPLTGQVTIAGLADALTTYLERHDLTRIDLVGSSVGARIVLELARRGLGRHVVALDPGGFWSSRQRIVFHVSIAASIRLIRLLQPVLPTLIKHPAGRTALLAQLSARPWALPPELVLRELRGWAAAPSYDALLRALAHGPDQEGAPAQSTPGNIVIGWGRSDRVVTPSQAATALARFPGASLHWFDACGHFPMWDQPEQTVRLILDSTA